MKLVITAQTKKRAFEVDYNLLAINLLEDREKIFQEEILSKKAMLKIVEREHPEYLDEWEKAFECSAELDRFVKKFGLETPEDF
jgi:hypothetical protein